MLDTCPVGRRLRALCVLSVAAVAAIADDAPYAFHARASSRRLVVRAMPSRLQCAAAPTELALIDRVFAGELARCPAFALPADGACADALAHAVYVHHEQIDAVHAVQLEVQVVRVTDLAVIGRATGTGRAATLEGAYTYAIDDGLERVLDQGGGAPCAVTDARMGDAGAYVFRAREVPVRRGVHLASAMRLGGEAPAALADVVATELARCGAFELLDRAQLGAVMAELKRAGGVPRPIEPRPAELLATVRVLNLIPPGAGSGQGSDATRGVVMVQLELTDTVTGRVAMSMGEAATREPGGPTSEVGLLRRAIDRAIEDALDRVVPAAGSGSR